MAINAAIIILGFLSPWIETFAWGRRIPLLEWLALELSRAGLLRFTVASPAVIVFAALIAAKAVLFRVWGTAYLGPATVMSMQMKARGVMADGPYRFLRNPLYLGLWCMAAALAFLMPPTGALVSMVLLTVFLLRLTLAEEAFLTAKLGEPYLEYLRAVPRFIPHLGASSLPPGGSQAHWFRAVLVETTPIGIFIALSVFSWSYDNRLMERVILIGFGFSLIARALMPGVFTSPGAPE